MIGVGILFIAIAAIAFLGFIINALFEKLKFTDVLPLMIIGLLIGPIFKFVNVGPYSIVSELTPYVTAIAISFVLFNIGISIKLKELKSVIWKASLFTFLTQISVGILLAVAACFVFKWSIIEAFIFGFAVSGPSTIIVPIITNLVKVPHKLKISLVYESVITDIAELIVPILLLGFMVNSNILSASYIGSFIFTVIFGSILLGVISALFWLFILNKFNQYSKDYSWILTLTMIIATYGVAEQFALNGAITVFVFGLLFYNIGSNKKVSTKSKNIVAKYFAIDGDVSHVIKYQREIVFFVSTFFFVYIGLLFNIPQANLFSISVAIVLSLLIIPARIIYLPFLGKFMSILKNRRKIEQKLISFDMARGLSPAIVATLPLTMGINIPYFIDVIFMIILFTNIISSIGIAFTYSPKVYSKRM
ncbi:MAG: cation:proton antiporter [Candidatus Micrarchaeia archaeon]